MDILSHEDQTYGRPVLSGLKEIFEISKCQREIHFQQVFLNAVSVDNEFIRQALAGPGKESVVSDPSLSDTWTA